MQWYLAFMINVCWFKSWFRGVTSLPPSLLYIFGVSMNTSVDTDLHPNTNICTANYNLTLVCPIYRTATVRSDSLGCFWKLNLQLLVGTSQSLYWQNDERFAHFSATLEEAVVRMDRLVHQVVHKISSRHFQENECQIIYVGGTVRKTT